MNGYLTDSSEKRVLLEFSDLILTNDDLQEDMTLSEQVNTETDIQAGTCCAVELNFSVINLNQLITKDDLAGKEFRYSAGVETSSRDVWPEMRKRGLFLAVRRGAFWYGTDQSGGVLLAWNGEAQINAPQPPQPIGSIFIRDGVLYCGYREAPFLTAYTIGANGTLAPKEITLSEFAVQKVQRYVSRGAAFSLTGEILLDFQKSWAGGGVISCQETVIEFDPIGVFTPETVTRENDNLLSVKAYDRMIRFAAPADDYLDRITYPITLLSYLRGLCAFYGVELATVTFPNADFMVKQNILTMNLPGRQVLQWIAEAAARFARFDPSGKLELAWYAEKGYTITASDYKEIEVSEYVTAPIDKVQIRSTKDDVGVIVGTGENAYVIAGNPLFYADTDAELRPWAQVIYHEMSGESYTPYSIECRGNPLIRAGDIVTLQSRKGQVIRALVMSRKLSGIRGLADTYEATGNRIRETQYDMANEQIIQLRGKVNEVSVTLDGTINRLYDANTGDLTQLKLTTQGIAAEVRDNADGISQLQATAKEISLSVSSVQTDVGDIQTAVGGLGETVERNTAQILLQADEIASKVSITDFDGNTIVSEINQSATTILIRASRINLQGYVTASELEAGNITITGKLESIYGSEKISMFNGYIELFYSNSLRGSLYTNSNNRQEICLSSKSGSLLFAAGGYLRGRILSNGTFDNQQYDFKTSGDFLMSGYYYADGYRGYSGSFKSSDGRTVTVKKGIITGVS